MSRTLRQGDQGADVRAVQDVLNFHIRRLDALEVDGKFGPLTKARVIEFQRSNKLKMIDGAVGNETAGKLFETLNVPLAIALMPRLQLTLPGLGGPAKSLQPPRLIPPLTLPGSVTAFSLPPISVTKLPPLTPQGQVLTLDLLVPSRNDPLDREVATFNALVQLASTLPANFPFRADIIGAVPKPDQLKKPGTFQSSFDWGVDPVFDIKKIGAPVEFGVGARVKFDITIALINRGANGLRLGLFAKGDFKAEFDYTSQNASSRPLMQLNGAIGVIGSF